MRDRMNASGMSSLMNTRLYRLGAFAYRRRWLVLLAWILIFVAMMGPLQKITDRLSQGGFEVPGSQSDTVKRAIESDFKGLTDLTDLLVLKSETLRATDPQYRSVFERIKTEVSKAPGVAFVSDPFEAPERSISKDGKVLTAIFGITGDQSQALKDTPKVEAAVKRGAAGQDAVKAYLTGAPPFYKAFTDTTVHDLERAEKIALPISLLILVVAFGSLIAAGLPVILALLGLAVSFGLISILAANVTVSTFAQNIASMIGIGVGIDYSLFILTRFREQLAEERSASQAVAEAMASSGKAVFVSAMTVVVALAGTQLVDIAAFRSMGFSAMIAVGIAGLAALTLMPALLGMLGQRVNKLSVRKNKTSESRAWHRWALAVMKRPWTALVLASAVIVAIALPALGLKMGSSGAQILPPDSPPRVAAEIAGEAFGEGQVAPVQILYDDPRGVVQGAGFADLHRVLGRIAKDPHVTRIDSIATLVPGGDATQSAAALQSPGGQQYANQSVARNGTRTLISVVSKEGAQSDETDLLVERIRTVLDSTLPAGARANVGGDPGLNHDLNNEMTSSLVPVVGLVLLLSFLVLMLFFRSILLPLKAIAMNFASVCATYGALVLIFQNGNLEGLLGFESTGNIDSFLPLFLFCILFGLSMDYEVFMLARIREEYARTGDNTEAVGWGLEHTAKIITSAALIMVTVFGAFVGASLVPIKAMGFGLAFAVLLDATIIRTVLVPATMRLMGDWNWWLPGWLDRLLPRVSIEESLPRRDQESAPANA